MSLLEYRKEHRTELGSMRITLNNLRNDLPELLDSKDDIPGKDTIEDKIKDFLKRVEQRLDRVSEDTCRVAVIGLEKAGKSFFINAWIGGRVLPTDTERCTWAATTVKNGEHYKADITFATKEEFDENLNKLYEEVGLDRDKIPFPLPKEPELLDRLEKLNIKRNVLKDNGFQDIRDLSESWEVIEPLLDKKIPPFTGNSISALKEQIYPYVARILEDGSQNGKAYAVKRVDIEKPIKDAELLNFKIDDLPGTNAPGNRAEKMTFDAIRNKADAIVFLKNAINSASLDRDEKNIWKVARNSDESITLSDKIFAVMTRADMLSEDNKRDAHEAGAKNFQKEGVRKDRIFLCSSMAELFKVSKNDFPYKFFEKDYKEACEKISRYFHSEPTTGFPEFKKALYKFLKDDFPVLEQKAFENLRLEFTGIVEEVDRILDACSDAALSESNANPKEHETFEKLWMPNDETEGEEGLGTMIFQKVNREVRAAKQEPEKQNDILNTIRDTINKSREEFLNGITKEDFIQLIDNRVLPDLPHTRSVYYYKKQEELKRTIYKKLALNIFDNTSNSLRDIWNAALREKTDEAVNGLIVIGESEIDEFLQKKLKGNSALKHLFIPEDSRENSTASISFAALLKSVAHAPAEYLLSSDNERYDANCIQLLQKACIYKKMINNEENRKKLEKARDDLKTQCNEYDAAVKDNRAGGLMKMIKENVMVIDTILDTILPGPLSMVSSIFLTILSKTDQKNPSGPGSLEDFFKPPTFEGEKTKPVSPEEYARATVKEIKERVELLYLLLEAMLFDPDFGFIGYYCSFLEEFRSDLKKELRVGGVIKEMAFKYRKQIWKKEPLFQDDERRKRLQDRIAKIKTSLPPH